MAASAARAAAAAPRAAGGTSPDRPALSGSGGLWALRCHGGGAPFALLHLPGALSPYKDHGNPPRIPVDSQPDVVYPGRHLCSFIIQPVPDNRSVS